MIVYHWTWCTERDAFSTDISFPFHFYQNSWYNPKLPEFFALLTMIMRTQRLTRATPSCESFEFARAVVVTKSECLSYDSFFTGGVGVSVVTIQSQFLLCNSWGCYVDTSSSICGILVLRKFPSFSIVFCTCYHVVDFCLAWCNNVLLISFYNEWNRNDFDII